MESSRGGAGMTQRRHIAGMTGQFDSLEDYMEYHRQGRQERTPRGEKHANAKLTEAQVTEIRRSYYAGKKDCSVLSKEYGVSTSSVENIVNGTTWAHVQEAPSPELLADIKHKRRLESQAKATQAMTKLTEADVQAIRAEYVPGKVRMKDIAAKYGVKQPTISDIITRRSWNHI
jgi:predicted DNA binding protein